MLCSAAFLGASTVPAYAADGAQGATALLLNGTGVRRAASTDLYSAALYLENKTTDPEQVMHNRGATQFRMVMLKDVKAAELSELLTQGLIANATDDDLVNLISEIFEVSVLLNEQGKLAAGDTIDVVSHPAGGTTLTLNTGTPSAQSFANPLFFKVMMAVWLGKQPADPGLKRALLGQPS